MTKMPSKEQFAFNSASGLVKHALELLYFQEFEGEVAIPAFWRESSGKMVFVVGENASGKSFFRRVVGAICQQAKSKTEYIPISMEGRRTVSYNPWLSFVYGDEGYQATGVLSSNTVITGVKTSEGRTGRHVIFWDEPDIGLSDSWSAGLGDKLNEFIKNPPEHLVASFVVTHSKSLVARVLDSNPHYLHLGTPPDEAPQSLQAWFEQPIKPRDITKLGAESHRRFKLIQRILGRNKP